MQFFDGCNTAITIIYKSKLCSIKKIHCVKQLVLSMQFFLLLDQSFKYSCNAKFDEDLRYEKTYMNPFQVNATSLYPLKIGGSV